MNDAKPDPSQQTSSFTSVSTVTYSSMGSTNTKYGGLIEISTYKKVRNSLFELIPYVFKSAPNIKIVHIVMMWLRLIQLAGPCLCITFTELWTPNETLTRVFSYLSVFWNLLPPENRIEACPFLLLVINILFIAYYALILVYAFYYKKYAKLPPGIAEIIVLYQVTLSFFLHPVATAHAFEEIGYLANYGIDDTHNAALSIAMIVIYILVLLGFFWLSIQTSLSIEFRDNSLQCILCMPQVQVFSVTILVTALSTICTHLNRIGKAISCFLMACSYAFLFANRLLDGGFIKPYLNTAIATLSVTGALVSVLCGVLLILEEKMSVAIVFVIIGVAVLITFIMIIIEKKRQEKYLIILDSIANDEPNQRDISQIRSVRHFLSIIIVGFQRAHPECIGFTIFNDATCRWPKDVKVWATFIKFLAIYPECESQLNLVCQRVITNRLNGYIIKNIIQQAFSLNKSRDVNLTPELKKKLSYLSKKVQGAKHKMRHIWDLVIQGNLNEMDRAVESCCKSVDNCSTEYDHVVRQYSNNRFIARSYTRFCHEILANHQLAIEWYDKTRLLQRGICTATDDAHEQGLEAFPLLPPILSMNNIQKNTTDFESSMATTDMLDLDEENTNQAQVEQGVILSETIDKLNIPSLRRMNIIRIIIIFVLFLIPVIFFTIYLPIVVDDLVSPLDFIYTLSYLRCIGFQVAIIGHHYVLETIPEKLLSHVERTDRSPPVSLGSSYDPRTQLEYLLSTGTSMLQTLSSFSSFKKGNPTMDAARETIFGQNMNYIFFKGRGDRVTVLTSLQVGMMDVFNQLYSLLEYTPITDENSDPANPLDSSILNSSKILNSVQNAETFGNFIIECLDLVIQYMKDRNSTNSNTFLIITIAFPVVYLIVQFLVTFFGLRSIRKEKLTVYRCLTALPKNVVSTVAEYLRVLQKDKEHSSKNNTSEEVDVNKQEDNILKILMTGDSGGGVKSDFLIIIITCIHCALFIAFSLYVSLSMIHQGDYLVSEAPHIDYLLGAYTYDAATVLATDLMLGEFYNLSTDFLISTLLTRFQARLERSQDYYSRLLYGDLSQGITPFQAFAEGLNEATQKLACEDISSKPPETVYDGYKCIRPDVMFYIHHNMVLSLTLPVKQNNATIDKDNEMLPEIYDLSLMLLFENFFFPIFNDVVSALKESFDSSITPIIAISYVLFVIALILEIFVLFINMTTKKYLIFSLKLLMHCPISAVHQCQKISRVLSGDFSSLSHENAARNEKFFDNLLQDLPKAVVICDLQGTITHSNAATERLFNRTDFINKNIKEVLGDKSPKEFDMLSAISKPHEYKVAIPDQEGSLLHIIVTMRPTHSMIAITFTDITHIVRYNTLINEEKKKSDTLLAAILPPSLVPRVQRGESDISFAVQSASIMFTDIVEFTPWCGSNTGAVVMSTLNTLFKEFDLNLAKYSTMTKIKCIGDCYMAAGGIFSEVFNPTQHANDAVDFGLDQLNAVNKINGQLGISLRVRVGVNTGGPIVAGVLGVGKPTFEILGPAINMAQQMEHHGVPMQVHISRSVYELIYGGKFKIKERGNIEVKNGTVRTYLVSNDQS